MKISALFFVLVLVLCNAGCSPENKLTDSDDILSQFIGSEVENLDEAAISFNKEIIYNGQKEIKSIDGAYQAEFSFMEDYIEVFRKGNDFSDSSLFSQAEQPVIFVTPGNDTLTIHVREGIIHELKIRRTNNSMFRESETSLNFIRNKGYTLKEKSTFLNWLSDKMEVTVNYQYRQE